LKTKNPDSEFSLISQEEFSLSNKGLLELMQATLVKGACFRIKVNGFSMSPFIKDSDVVTVSALKDSHPGLGKVTAFINPRTNKLVIHRILGRSNGSYLIKGDNALCADGLVPEENILGCVTKIERNGRQIYFGLHKGRAAIALFSRIGLWRLVFYCWRVIPLAIRNAVKAKLLSCSFINNDKENPA
jgi:hypothetical protein